MKSSMFRRAGLGMLLPLLTLCVALSAAGSAVLQAQTDKQVSPLFKLLPEADSMTGWVMKDKPQTFEGDDLFLYIDGGAEIYHEYGFTRAIAQDYWKGEDSITVEIFEMADPGAAFGIFAHKRGPDGKSMNVGTTSSLEGYYVNFWRGHYLVTLTASQESEAVINGLRTAAGIIDSRIKDQGNAPVLVDSLPAEGLQVSSIKYMRGPLGFLNVCSLFPPDVFLFREGVKGDYAAGYSAYVLRYDEAGAASEAMKRAEKAVLGDAAKYRGASVGGTGLGFENVEGKTVRITLRGQIIIMIIGDNKTAAEAGLAALQGAAKP